MAREHKQNSNWDNANQAPAMTDQNSYLEQQRPMNGSPYAQDINVVTRLVSNYDPRNVTVAKTIIQPIAIVPYSATQQEMHQYAQPAPGYYGGEMGDCYDYNENDYDNYSYDDMEQGTQRKAKKGVNALKIILILLSLISIAVVVLGKFVSLAYFKFDSTRSGLEILLTITSIFAGGVPIKDMLFPILLAVNCLFTVFILLDGIFGAKKGVNIFIKVIAVMSLLCIGGFGYLVFSGGLGLGYGLYIVAGATALTAILCLFGKRRR